MAMVSWRSLDPGRVLGWLRGVRTPFDTPEIIARRKAQRRVPKTYLIETIERGMRRQEIALKLYGSGARQRERKAFIVLGPPAAGKSRIIVEPLAAEHGALVIDADKAKEFIPEYAGGAFAGAVHEESAEIAYERVLPQAMINGDNIILAVIGKNAETVRTYKDVLRAYGYEVHLRLLHLPPLEAARRTVERWRETGRFVDPLYVLKDVGSQPKRVFDTVKVEEGWASYEAWSNEVPKGQPPQLLERSVFGRS